jgi:hypothetical protein
MGRSMSGIIHMVNQTPIVWFVKKHNVVETIMYGSQFMVSHQSMEQIMDLCYTLRITGIPFDGPSGEITTRLLPCPPSHTPTSTSITTPYPTTLYVKQSLLGFSSLSTLKKS